MSIKSKIISGLGWTAGASFLGQLVTWGITIVVMRILSPADYGLLAMSSVFVAFLSMMAAAGLGPAIIQASAIDDGRMRQLLGLIITINIALFLLLYVAAPAISRFFGEPRLVDIVRVLSAQFVLSAFAVIPDALLGRALKFKPRALVELSSSIAGAAVTLALALAGQGVWSLVAGAMATSISRVIGFNLLVPQVGWPIFSIRGVGPFLAFGGNVTASRVLWFFYSQADVFIVGRVLGKEALGFYSVAMHLASLPVQKVSGILNQVAFPAFSQIQNDKTQIAAHVAKSVRAMSFFAFPILWGISSVAPEFIGLLLGSKWHAAILPLQVLPAIMPLRMISNFLPSAVDAVGRPDISVKNLVSASIIMPLAFVLGVQWGVQGLCIAWLVAFPVVFLGNLLRALPAVNLRLGDLLMTIAWPVFASTLMYAAVFAMGKALSPDLSAGLRLVLLVATGALVYGGLALTTNRRGLVEIRAFMKQPPTP
jgi:teichuronic acid exporter